MKRSPMKRTNPRRRASRLAEQFGPKSDWIRSLPCLIEHRAPGPHVAVQAAHVRSRVAGGTSSDLVPLCWDCHGWQHVAGIVTFQDEVGVNLTVAARMLEYFWIKRLASLGSDPSG